MPRATEVIISLPALRHNLRLAAGLAPNSKIWAVVKADAYGHGIEAVLPSLAQADGFALVEFERAAQLRALGVTAPILMLEGAFT
ncbi:MAG: alanine racemase, partial [Betaproteobacteria bacterium]